MIGGGIRHRRGGGSARARGRHVSCLDLEGGKAAGVAARCGARACRREARAALDIRHEPGVNAALEAIHERHGRLDIVVATPSINVRKTILQYTDEEFDACVTVNLKGNFNVLQAAGRDHDGAALGSIVIFSSIRSLVVEPGQSVYAVTKAGDRAAGAHGAAEFGPDGVRVNAVAPGVVETPLTAPIKANTELVRRLRRQERAEAVGAARTRWRAHGVPRLRRRQLRDRDRCSSSTAAGRPRTAASRRRACREAAASSAKSFTKHSQRADRACPTTISHRTSQLRWRKGAWSKDSDREYHRHPDTRRTTTHYRELSRICDDPAIRRRSR